MSTASLPLDRWPALRTVGPDVAIGIPETGTMNDTWLLGDHRADVTAAYVLRRHRFRDQDRVRHEHRVMDHARRGGVPVPDVLPTDDGDRLLRHDERWWSLYGFAPGVQVARADLTPRHAHAMGNELGRLHAALADLDHGAEDPPVGDAVPTASRVLDEIAELRLIIAELPDRRVEDDWADAQLAGHADWIERHGLTEPVAVPGDEVQVLHGDYQESNVFFVDDGAGTRVSAVIDWDKSETGARGFEIVRCLKLGFRFDVALCRSFLEGYRHTAELTTGQLLRAVHNEHARDLRGLWVPTMIYRRGQDQVRRFLEPGGFRAVLDIWPDELR